jgi:hypothetical protein
MLPAVLGGTTENMTLSKRFATRLGEQSLRRWGTGLGALTLAISGLFGGLKVAEPEGPPKVEVNAPVEGGAWRVTIQKAQLHPELKPILLQKKEDHFIVVVALVEITAERSWTSLSGILRLSNVDGVVDKVPQVALVKDGSRVGVLHPGMPEQVAFFWERSASAKVPKEVTVQVMGNQFRESSLDGTRAGKQWLDDSEPRAQIVVPLVDKRTAATPTASPKATASPKKS